MTIEHLTVTPPPPPVNPPATTTSEKPDKPERKKSRWRRRIVIGFLAVVAIAVLLRVVLVLTLPSVIRKVAGTYGLDARHGRMEMYLIEGDVGIWDLTLTPKGAAAPLVASEYLRANVSAINLLRGKLVVHRVEADGVELNVDRDETGQIPALRQLMSSSALPPSSAPATPAAKSSTQTPQELTLDPPLRIDALRLNRVQARVRDRSVKPPLDTTLELTVRLSHLGSASRPTRFLLDAASPPLLDSLRVEGEGNARGQVLDANFRVVARGLHPKPAAGYLAPLGLRGYANDVALQMTAKVKTAPTTRPAGTASTQPADIGGTLLIENVIASADGQETAGVDRVQIDLVALNNGAPHFANLIVEGARGNATRTAAGDFRFGGLDFFSPEMPRERPKLPAGWSLDQVSLRKLRATFRDDSVTPPADLSLIVDDLLIRRIVDTPQAESLQISGQLAAPGVAKSIQIKGSATPLAPVKRLELKVVASGIRPDALRGYLHPAGLESRYQDGTLTCDLTASASQSPDGRIHADANLANVKLTDGKDLFAFDGVKVAGASLDPASGGIRAAAIELTGPKLTVTREADGTLIALGMRTKPAVAPAIQAAAARSDAAKPQAMATQPAGSALTVAETAEPTTTAVTTRPTFEIGKLTWTGVDIQFDDRAVSSASKFALNDAGLEITDLRVSSDERAPATQPGKVRGWLALPGVVGKLALDGTILPQPDGLAIDLLVNGAGIDARRLQPYLAAAGIEPVLKDGSLRLRTVASVASVAGGLTGDIAVTDLRYADGADELIKLGGLRVGGVTMNPREISIASVDVDKPHARVARQKDGSVLVAGVRIPAAPSLGTQSVTSGPPASSMAPGPATAPSPAAAPPPMIASLKKLRVAGATINWRDAAVEPAVDALAHADASVDGLVVGRDAPPATFQILAKVDKAIQQATIAGTIAAAPTTQQAMLEVTATGVNAQVFESYLPPNVLTTLRDGRFRVKVDATVADHPAGGKSARLLVDNFDYRDGPAAGAADGNAAPAAGQPLFHFDSARVLVSRFDVPGKVVAIDEISLAGLETQARRGSTGSWSLLGLNVAAAAEDAKKEWSPPPSTSQPAAQARPATAPTTGPADAGQILAARRVTAPLVTVRKLDVQLRSVAITGSALPDPRPLALRNVRLRNLKPIEMLGDDAASRPPVEFELTGQADPLVRRFDVQTKASPFASTPTLDVAVTVDGINGQDVTQLLPELEKQLDGRPLRNGRFTARVEGQAKVDRRGPVDFDFSKPYELALSVRDVALRNGNDTADAAGTGGGESRVLIGVEEIRAEAVRVQPATGDVVVRALEITKPMGFVYRDAEGIHALGFLLKTVPAADGSAPSTTSAGQASLLASADDRPDAAAAMTKPATRPASEIRIDKLVISGLDFTVEDRTAEPALIVPLNGLEVEARGLSNLAAYEDRPVRFSILTTADRVKLVDGKETPLFSEVAANGNLSLYPKPKGWVRSTVSGFEILSLYGVAKQQKVTLGGGVFDGSVDVRLPGDGSMDTRSRFGFTDLKASEPPDGIIRRTLQLPSSLDAVILVLQDHNGMISVPLNVPVKEGEVSGGAIAGQAVGAFALIVGQAIASTPLKIVGGVGSMLGMPKEEEPKGPRTGAAIAFVPGAAESSALSGELAPLLEQLRRNPKLEATVRHELGGGDVAACAGRASPPPDEAAQLAQRLRERKADLLDARRQAAGRARAIVYTTGGGAAQQAVDQLRAIDREVAATEDALDQVYDLLRPGADRQASRRTRAACVELAEARLDATKALLMSSGIPNIQKRVRVVNPRFTEAEGDAGGRVVCTVLEKKKS